MGQLLPEFIRSNAQQHTFCNKALMATYATIDQYTSGRNDGIDELVAEIRALAGLCYSSLHKKKLSAGAKRDITAWADVIAEHAALYGFEGEQLFFRWCSSIVCAELMLFDCKITCKDWFVGEEWCRLHELLDTLSTCVQEICPESLQQGNDIYMVVG